MAELGERRGLIDRGVLIVLSGRCQPLDLVAVEGVELAGIDDLRPLHEIGGGGVFPKPPNSLRPLEDAVQHRQVAVLLSSEEPGGRIAFPSHRDLGDLARCQGPGVSARRPHLSRPGPTLHPPAAADKGREGRRPG
jgi:hypothetical protein